MYSTSRYNKTDIISILNAKQAAYYWNNGLQPIDIYPSKDMISGSPVMVFVFKRSETKDLYDKWCKEKPTFNN